MLLLHWRFLLVWITTILLNWCTCGIVIASGILRKLVDAARRAIELIHPPGLGMSQVAKFQEPWSSRKQ